MRPRHVGASAPSSAPPSVLATAAPVVVASSSEANGAAAPAPLKLHWRWTQDDFLGAARQCNGCGACRTQAPDLRMCPIFRASPAEEASPRAKANLIRGMLTGQLDAQQPLDENFKAIADLCVHCHMCRVECPASVDIPKLMAEAKSAYLEVHGQSIARWALANVDTLSAIGSYFRPLANWALANRGARWLLEKMIGLAPGANFPASRPGHSCARPPAAAGPAPRGKPSARHFISSTPSSITTIHSLAKRWWRCSSTMACRYSCLRSSRRRRCR